MCVNVPLFWAEKFISIKRQSDGDNFQARIIHAVFLLYRE